MLRSLQFVSHIAVSARLSSALLALSGVILLGLGVLLAIELGQDRQLNAYHLHRRRMKLHFSSSAFECQACGSQQVVEKDAVCRSCGVVFEDVVTAER